MIILTNTNCLFPSRCTNYSINQGVVMLCFISTGFRMRPREISHAKSGART